MHAISAASLGDRERVTNVYNAPEGVRLRERIGYAWGLICTPVAMWRHRVTSKQQRIPHNRQKHRRTAPREGGDALPDRHPTPPACRVLRFMMAQEPWNEPCQPCSTSFMLCSCMNESSVLRCSVRANAVARAPAEQSLTRSDAGRAGSGNAPSVPSALHCHHRSMLSTKQSLTRSEAVRPRSFTCTTEPSPSTSSPIACRQHPSITPCPTLPFLIITPRELYHKQALNTNVLRALCMSQCGHLPGKSSSRCATAQFLAALPMQEWCVLRVTGVQLWHQREQVACCMTF